MPARNPSIFFSQYSSHLSFFPRDSEYNTDIFKSGMGDSKRY